MVIQTLCLVLNKTLMKKNMTNKKISVTLGDLELISYETELPKIKTISISHNNSVYFEFISIDERTSSIHIPIYATDSHKMIIDLFNDFRNTNPSYGNIDSGDYYQYEGTETLNIKDFFNYIKSLNRNNKIDIIIN